MITWTLSSRFRISFRVSMPSMPGSLISSITRSTAWLRRMGATSSPEPAMMVSYFSQSMLRSEFWSRRSSSTISILYVGIGFNLVDGESQNECRALVGRTGHIDCPVVLFQYLVNDRESQAGPFRFGRKERVEYLGMILDRDSEPGIGNTYYQVRAASTRAHFHACPNLESAPIRHGIYGVEQQIYKHLLDLVGVEDYVEPFLAQVCFNVNMCFCQLRAHQIDRINEYSV